MVCGVLAAPEVLLVAGLAAVSAVEVSVFSAVLLAEVGVVGAVCNKQKQNLGRLKQTIQENTSK